MASNFFATKSRSLMRKLTKNYLEVIIMFERIKAYRTLRKSNKFLKGCLVAANITEDSGMLLQTTMALYMNDFYKKRMWRKRELAVIYNKAAESMFKSIK